MGSNFLTRGGWHFEVNGGAFRVCVNVAAVTASSDPAIQKLPNICSPWISVSDVEEEGVRVWHRVLNWFSKKKDKGGT